VVKAPESDEEEEGNDAEGKGCKNNFLNFYGSYIQLSKTDKIRAKENELIKDMQK